MILYHTSARIAAIAAFASFCCIAACAESGAQQNDPCDDKQHTYCIAKSDLEKAEPSIGWRIARVWSYQYQFSEQPAIVLATVNGQNKLVTNPERYLNQHTVNFQLSELFPNTSNLAAVVAAIYTASQNSDQKAGIAADPKTLRLDKLCGNSAKRTQFQCLASGGNFWQRLLSAVTGSVAWSERDEAQQGVIVNNFTPTQHYGPAGEIDFDPASLFINASAWKTVLASLKGIPLDPAFFTGGANKLGDAAPCFTKDPKNSFPDEYCVKIFARPRFSASKPQGGWTVFGAGLIPKFQFKVVDQFDFIKNGGVLVPQAGLQRSLKNYSFIWDLRRVVPSTSDRIAMLASYRSLDSKAPKEKDTTQQKVCVTVAGSTRGYIPVGDGFTVEHCLTAAHNAGATSFALGCATFNTMDIGDPHSFDLKEPPQLDLPKGNSCHWGTPRCGQNPCPES
jgi:hypothetical protein